MGAEIVRLGPDELSMLGEFLKRAYPADRKWTPAYLDWYFLQNPNSEEKSPPVWVVKSAGEIVGQVATIPVELKAGENTTKAVWILEFILLPEFRGQGLGKRLIEEVGRSYPTMITLGINEASTRVFTSLGWKPLGGIHRYHRMLFLGSAAKRGGLTGGALDLLSLPLRISLKGWRRANSFEIRHDSTVDRELDALWKRASRQWPAAVRREHQYLTWQFRSQPGKKFEMIKLYERGSLAGYAVLFFRRGPAAGHPPKAAISDLVYDERESDGVIDGLLDAALEMAIRRRAGSLVTDVLDFRVERRLGKHGFWRIQKSPRFMASSSEFSEVLYRPENWYLTRADSDVSIFEEPNIDEA
jgi:GNAT superfamily N-acetyltransferase